MRPWWILAIVACSSSGAAPDDRSTAAPAPATPSPTPSPIDPRRWIAGDVHMHVAPPDTDVVLSVSEIAKSARAAGMEFVVLTPHLWPGRRGPDFDKAWRAMAIEARATRGIALVPGIEWTTTRGHFTVAGVDVTSSLGGGGGGGGDLLLAAHAAGAWISVNHPYALPTRIPGVLASHYDLSYRAWTGRGRAAPLDGVEVWNLPLGLANVISRPGGTTGEARAWLAADRIARTEHHRMTAVGGTDNHKRVVVPTTWVLATAATEHGILEALRAGATCVGGPEAGTLRARGDGDWVRIGGIVHGPRVELVWDGPAELFVDGVDRGERTGWVGETSGVPHTYRIVVGQSRCGFVYANL